MSSFGFEYPWVLLLLPLFVLCAKFCQAKESALLFSNLRLIKKVGRGKSFFLEFLKYSALFLTVVALASPIKRDSSYEVKKQGYDIVLAIDASGSMREKGFDPTRLDRNKFEVVKELIKEFIKRRENDNLGVVVFGSFAYAASPLSFDKEFLSKLIDFLQIGVAGQKTAITDALALSIELLKKGEARSKIVILLTDGNDTAGRVPPEAITKMAKKHSVKIYTIAIGDEEGINKKYLKFLADQSGGEFFFAGYAQDLKEVYKRIDALEKSKIKQTRFIKVDRFYIYPLFLATIFLLLYIYYYSRRGV